MAVGPFHPFSKSDRPSLHVRRRIRGRVDPARVMVVSRIEGVMIPKRVPPLVGSYWNTN